MRKMTMLVSGGIGYVLGARAGRERYEQIRGLALKVKGNPTVQATAHQGRGRRQGGRPGREGQGFGAADAAVQKVKPASDTAAQRRAARGERLPQDLTHARDRPPACSADWYETAPPTPQWRGRLELADAARRRDPPSTDLGPRREIPRHRRRSRGPGQPVEEAEPDLAVGVVDVEVDQADALPGAQGQPAVDAPAPSRTAARAPASRASGRGRGCRAGAATGRPRAAGRRARRAGRRRCRRRSPGWRSRPWRAARRRAAARPAGRRRTPRTGR